MIRSEVDAALRRSALYAQAVRGAIRGLEARAARVAR